MYAGEAGPEGSREGCAGGTGGGYRSGAVKEGGDSGTAASRCVAAGLPLLPSEAFSDHEVSKV